MKLRTRILLTSVMLVVIPLVVLAVVIRAEMERRLTAQYTDRIGAMMTLVEDEMSGGGADLGERLEGLRLSLGEDNRIRLAVSGDESQRPHLLDAAGHAMALMGLDMLQIQDRSGVILSSGHFRMEYGNAEPGLPRGLAARADGTALVRARLPRGGFLALARVDSLLLGDRFLYLVGGKRIDGPYLSALARDRDLAVSLVPDDGGALSSDPTLQSLFDEVARTGIDEPELALGRSGYLVRAQDLPLLSAGGVMGDARLVVSHPLTPLRAILRNLDLWLALAVLAALAGSAALAVGLSSRVTRPLDRLARQTAALDLERLDADFDTDREDEVGTLSRFLQAMVERLRAGAARLREAERHATLGEVARQVNHDVRNGLTPLRNVLRHLGQVADDQPERLGEVFRDRRPTLESGLAYLEDLAANYARLSPPRDRRHCDLNEIVSGTVDAAADRARPRVSRDLAPALPPVLADPVGLRRIVENLVRNALESLPEGRGTVAVSTSSAVDPDTGGTNVVLEVRDDGCGIEPGRLDDIFTDFFTTKEGGSGLGLSNVRRLVTDCEGTVKVASEPGEGAVFTVVLPAAGATRAVPADEERTP